MNFLNHDLGRYTSKFPSCADGLSTLFAVEAVKPGASLNDLGNAAARTNKEIAALRALSPGTERRMDMKTLHRGSVSLKEDRVRDLASVRGQLLDKGTPSAAHSGFGTPCTDPYALRSTRTPFGNKTQACRKGDSLARRHCWALPMVRSPRGCYPP